MLQRMRFRRTRWPVGGIDEERSHCRANLSRIKGATTDVESIDYVHPVAVAWRDSHVGNRIRVQTVQYLDVDAICRGYVSVNHPVA